MSKTDMQESIGDRLGPQYAFSMTVKGSAVDVILFTNPSAKFYASAHTHSGHEFHYIAQGSSSLRIGAESHAMTAGNCYLVAKGTFHDVKMLSHSVCRLSALIDPAGGEGLFGKLPAFTSLCPSGDLEQILRLLLSALQNGKGEAYARACTELLLMELAERLSPAAASIQTEERAVPVSRSAESVKQEILSYLANNLATASLEELGVLLHMSTRQTARFLRDKMGDSFSNLLRKHRIECAKALMLSGNLSLEEIAFLSGYSSYKGFHSAFCKYTGINPKAYKQSRYQG